MLPVAGGKSGLKPQGTVSHAKQWRVDQKKYNSIFVDQTLLNSSILHTFHSQVWFPVYPAFSALWIHKIEADLRALDGEWGYWGSL